MGNIIFLRHGQAMNNVKRVLSGRSDGIPLTSHGAEQIRHAAELISHMDVSAIYSSPIQRAKDSAEIVGEEISVPVDTDERLIELDMGKFTGMSYNDIFRERGNVFMQFYSGDLNIAHNGVETFGEVKKRVTGIVEHVTESHPGQNVVLVTHMDPIKAMLSTVLDLSPTNLFEMVIANASLSIFQEADDRFYVSAINLMHPSRYGKPQ